MRIVITPRRPRTVGRRTAAAALAALLSVAAAGCGGSSDSSGRSSAGGADLDAVKASVEAAYTGTYTAPPTKPTAPAAGQKLWVISCGQIAVGCSTPSDAATKAAEAIGWDVTVYDGKLGADNAYATGVRQAVAAKADAIVVVAIDCPFIKQPLQEARAAGITVVSLLSYDCDDPRLGGGEALFSGDVIPNEKERTVAAYSIAQGRMKADWVTARTGGKPVALSLDNTDSVLGQDIAKGFDDRIKACSSCELVSLPFTLADIGGGAVPTKVSQALLRNPSINAVMAPYDSLMALGAAQAIKRSESGRDIAAIGGEGYGPNLELIRTDGGQDAAVYESTAWFGWAAVDSVVRLLNDEPIEPAGIGSQLVDKDHFPKTDKNGIVPPVDFEAAYLKAWGR